MIGMLCTSRIWHRFAPIQNHFHRSFIILSNRSLPIGRGEFSCRNFSSQQTENDRKKRGQDDGTWISRSTLLMVTVGACGIGAYLNISSHLRKESEVASVVVGQSVGKLALGGPFQLIDHNQKVVSDSSFNGRWMFIYFGFTYCPDICPNELLRMTETLNFLDSPGGVGSQVLPLFITIDPKRDGPEQLKNYLSDWHPRLVGLTGTQQQVDEVCKRYRVYYSKAQLGPDPMDYLIDHSVMFYLVAPDGTCVDYFAKNFSPQQMAERITSYVNGWKGS